SLIGESREALSDPTLGEPVALADLKELAGNMPALARAFISQSRRLKQATEEIAAYAARLGDDRLGRLTALPSTPFEEVRDFFYTNHNYIDELDRAAEAVAQEMGMPLGRMEAATARRLEDRHGLRLADLREVDGAGVQRSFDAETQTVRLSRRLLPGQRAFQMATQIAFLEQRDLIDRLAAQGSFSNDEARS